MTIGHTVSQCNGCDAGVGQADGVAFRSGLGQEVCVGLRGGQIEGQHSPGKHRQNLRLHAFAQGIAALARGQGGDTRPQLCHRDCGKKQGLQRLRINRGDDAGMGRRSQGLGDQIGVDTDRSSDNSRGVARSRCVI